jgi:cysteine desulfurase
MTLARSGAERPEPLLDMDHAATTALCEEARVAMEPFLGPAGGRGTRHGNPSGTHALARDATRAVDEAREVVAESLGCEPGEVVFTSGGTEADNHAVTGGMPPRPGVPWCSAVEHHAVLAPTRALGGTTVGVDRLGRVDLDELAERLEAAGRVPLVSVMLANNELGTRNDLHAVAAVLRRCAPGAALHTDAVQAAPWLDLPGEAAPAQLVSVSSHKLGGPKGVGALVVRDGTSIGSLLHGGGQERGRRGGTHDVAGIVGFAAALRAASQDRGARCARVAALRDELARRVLTELPGVRETVGPEVAAALGLPRDRSHLLPGHCHLMIEGVGSEELLLVLEQHGVCASAAASCASGAQAPSHVLSAIGALHETASGAVERRAALRLSLGVDTTAEDVRRTAGALRDAVHHIRAHHRRRIRFGEVPAARGAGS